MTADAERWRAIGDLFDAALAIDASERAAFVAARAGDDHALASEVFAMLEAHAGTHTVLDAPAASRLPRGLRIGPYAIERTIASGGSATVYLARRADRQFDKLVAVKLVNVGLTAALTGDRVELERQILARLEHPHIARLFDAGITEFGQPYLVMEWVDGVALDVWMVSERPSMERRLDLWADVADAVGYAHRNLIIHRDLKPSNVLVGRDGVAKLVDFGIAKLLDPDGAHAPTRTLHLTPLYASPEQLRGEPVSTAADVHGLGLLLCELVTGAHPFRRPGRSPHEDARAALTEDPEIAPGTPPDLASIIRMALRKEADRRYTSVAAFVDDVKRYRRGMPVIAQPDTLGYRVRRFTARHRVGVAIAAAVVVGIAASLAAAVWQARVAAQQASVAIAARDRANVEARKAAQVNEFLQEMLGAADPTRDGRDVRVADLLDRAGARVATEFAGQPELEAATRGTLARTYQRLGLLDPALSHAREAVALRERIGGRADPQVAQSLLALGDVLFERGDYPEAEAQTRRALEIYRAAGLENSVEAAGAMRELGEVLNDMGRYPEAEALYRRSLALYQQHPAGDEAGLAHALNDLGVLLGSRGAFAEAEPLHRRALDLMRRAYGPQHLEYARTLHNVAGVIDSQGRLAEAEPLYVETLAIERKLLGDDHPTVILTQTSLANLLWMKKEFSRAEQFARAAIDSAGRALPPVHPLSAYAEVVLGQTLTDAGRPGEGEAHLRRALAARRTLLGDRHWLVANTRSVLGGCLLAQGRLAEAQPLLRESYALLLSDRGPDHERTRDARRRVELLDHRSAGSER